MSVTMAYMSAQSVAVFHCLKTSVFVAGATIVERWMPSTLTKSALGWRPREALLHLVLARFRMTEGRCKALCTRAGYNRCVVLLVCIASHHLKEVSPLRACLRREESHGSVGHFSFSLPLDSSPVRTPALRPRPRMRPTQYP